MKSKIYEACLAFIQQRIATANEALKQAQEASNDDTKSSAGDKFETSREMAQQDINRNKLLLADAQQQNLLLGTLADIGVSPTVRTGSLAVTDQGSFYIGISAGQLVVDGEIYFAISAVSPIGKLLLGKSVGDKFEFNGKGYEVQEIF